MIKKHALMVILKILDRNYTKCFFCISLFFICHEEILAQWKSSYKLDYWYHIKGHKRGINCLAVSKDASIVVTGSSDGVVKIWKYPEGFLSGSFRLGFSIISLDISPSNRYAAVGLASGKIVMLDLINRRVSRTLNHGSSILNALAFTRGGGYLISAAYNGTIKLWNVNRFKLVRTSPNAHAGGIFDIVLSKDNSYFITGGADGRIKHWSTKTGDLKESFETKNTIIRSIAIDPSERLIACGTNDGKIMIIDLNAGELIRALKAHESSVSSVDFSQNGDFIVSSSWDETIKLWSTENGKELFSISQNLPVLAVKSINDNASTIVSCGWNKLITYWKIKKYFKSNQ